MPFGFAAGKSEQDILTAICKQYEPYDRFPEFGEGFVDYQARRRDKSYDGAAGQAYDRGANAALWLWQAQQRMKPPRSDLRDFSLGSDTEAFYMALSNRRCGCSRWRRF